MKPFAFHKIELSIIKFMFKPSNSVMSELNVVVYLTSSSHHIPWFYENAVHQKVLYWISFAASFQKSKTNNVYFSTNKYIFGLQFYSSTTVALKTQVHHN